MSLAFSFNRFVLSSFALPSLLMTFACDVDGGLNQNQKSAGNQEDGVELRVGDLAIDPTGKFVLATADEQLFFAEIERENSQVISEIQLPQRLAFDDDGKTIYVSSLLYDWGDLGKLIAYDTQKMSELWSESIKIGLGYADNGGLQVYPRIESYGDDRLLLVYENRIEIRNSQNGEIDHQLSFAQRIIDHDISEDHQLAWFTLNHEWGEDGVPDTEIAEVNLLSGKKQKSIHVPNCADEMLISKASGIGLMAPTRCAKDPVSLVDLESGEWIRNLPGFGPVDLSNDQSLGIAFLDLDNVDRDLFESDEAVPERKDGRYHLMLIELEDFSFETMPLGDDLPRYALTPDGKMLLVDSPFLFEDNRVRILNVDEKKLEVVNGPNISLNQYVFTSDSAEMYALDGGLYNLDLSGKELTSVSIPFAPENINITPNDEYLLLRENSSRFWVYDRKEKDLLRSIEARGNVDSEDASSEK